MSLHDFRTKPESQWTYYVVDHLPRMGNIYRYDTPEEAVARYQSLDPGLQSSIGSSIGGVHELDLIHRRSNNTSVYLKDAERIAPNLWRNSPEAQEAIDYMLRELKVTYALNNQIFGEHLSSVLVDLDRNQDKTLDRYYSDHILYPDTPRRHNQAIVEVFEQGRGWLKRDDFMRTLQTGIPHDPKAILSDHYISRLSVRYMDMKTGYFGQADLSPQEYTLLCEKTKQLLSPEKLAKDLHTFLSEYSPDAPVLQGESRRPRISDFQAQIQSGYLSDFQKAVSQVLVRQDVGSEAKEQARQLYSRIMALTPRDFQRTSLASKIAQAESVSAPRQNHKQNTYNREEER